MLSATYPPRQVRSVEHGREQTKSVNYRHRRQEGSWNSEEDKGDQEDDQMAWPVSGEGGTAVVARVVLNPLVAP